MQTNFTAEENRVRIHNLYRFLKEVLNLDDETASAVEIEPVSENKYHMTFDKYNPYDGMDFMLEVIEAESEVRYAVTNSKYADDTEVTLQASEYVPEYIVEEV